MYLLSKEARNRLVALVQNAEPRYGGIGGVLRSNADLIYGPSAPMYDGAAQVLLQRAGIDVAESGYTDADALLREAGERLVSAFVLGVWVHVGRIRDAPMTAQQFENSVNNILANDSAPYRMRSGRYIPLGESEAEVLRRTLLAAPDDMAACQQGDVQVEMVVSSLQARLAHTGAVLVDYGVGLGRVLAGLASAKRFADATYVAVDEPMPSAVTKLAGEVGAKAKFQSRTQYLAKPEPADVILVVNVLHHIPFKELGTQFATVLSALKPDGIMVIHEKAELREPEQSNVPWHAEDILMFLQTPTLELNPRTTVTKGKKVPLTNLLVTVKKQDPTLATLLSKNADAVWASMKARTLDEIRSLYDSRDEERHVDLQHALITNANLDLNRPG